MFTSDHIRQGKCDSIKSNHRLKYTEPKNNQKGCVCHSIYLISLSLSCFVSTLFLLLLRNPFFSSITNNVFHSNAFLQSVYFAWFYTTGKTINYALHRWNYEPDFVFVPSKKPIEGKGLSQLARVFWSVTWKRAKLCIKAIYQMERLDSNSTRALLIKTQRIYILLRINFTNKDVWHSLK